MDEELKQGWVYKFDGSVEDAKECFPHLAVGRLGVAFSDNRPPRLVVDSSVCVIRCFPLRNCNSDMAGFSLDIKAAHKRVVIKSTEQGLLGFQLNQTLYFYRVCPFGATFSSFWWQRLGGWILRFFHHSVWIPHAAWLYVDDYLWMQRRDILPLVATFLALMCCILRVPISWRKTELDISINWIGWTFHFVAGYIEIPKDKREKLMKYITQLVDHSRPHRSYLDKTIGLIMWITQLFPFMRIWVRHLYNDLYTIPCTNYSIDPGQWPFLSECLDDQLQFTIRPPSSAIPVGSTLVSVRHQQVTSKQDLQSLRLTQKRIWMRIRDPASDKRSLSTSSQRVLQLYHHWLNNFHR